MKFYLAIFALFFFLANRSFALENVAKSLPANFCTKNQSTNSFDCSQLLTESKSLKFCDESLSKLPNVNEYFKSYNQAPPKKACVTLTVKLKDNQQFETSWKLDNSEIPVQIEIEECKKKTTTFPLFKCTYKSIILQQPGESETHLIDRNSQFVVLNSGRPLMLPGAPKTYRSRVVDGKNRRIDYMVKPINVPSSRKLLVTQCYQSSFSHAEFEVDFSLVNREEVMATDMGVVTQNYQGSPLWCHSYASGSETRFDIYWNGIYVDQNLSRCKTKDCSVNVMPWYCISTHSANRLVIKHPDNTFSQYVHLAKNNSATKFGDVIPQAGVPISQIGISGWVAGAHLHFEVMDLLKNQNGHYDFFNIPTYFNTKNYGVTWPCARGGKLLEPF